MPPIKEILIQKLQWMVQRTIRYEKRCRFYCQNKISNEPQEDLQGNWKSSYRSPSIPPSIEKVQKCWENIWSYQKKCNPKVEWIKRGQERMKDKPVEESKNITKNNFRQALTKSPKWKSLENDKVHKLWFYHLSSVPKTFS